MVTFDHEESNWKSGQIVFQLLIPVRPPVVDAVVSQDNEQVVFRGIPFEAKLFYVLVISMAVALTCHKYM